MKQKHIYINIINEALKLIFQELSENTFIKNEYHFYFIKQDEKIISKDNTLITDNKTLILKHLETKNFNHAYYININSDRLENFEKLEGTTIISVPFKISDLMNRVQNSLTSQKIKKKKLIEFKNFIYDPSNRSFYNQNSALRFTEKENAIFNYLFTNRNKKIHKKELLNEIWKYGSDIDTHTLETHIYSLRKKISDKFGYKKIINYAEKNGYFLDIQKL